MRNDEVLHMLSITCPVERNLEQDVVSHKFSTVLECMREDMLEAVRK
jgi:hypothetical protein